MRHNILQRNVVFLHQYGSELRGALDGSISIIATIFAHFDADRKSISGTRKIGVFALLVGGHVLDRHAILYGEMPDEIANSVSVAGFGGAQRTIFQRQRMLCGPCGEILGAMNGNVARLHWAVDLPPVSPPSYHIRFQIHLPQHRGQRYLPTHPIWSSAPTAEGPGRHALQTEENQQRNRQQPTKKLHGVILIHVKYFGNLNFISRCKITKNTTSCSVRLTRLRGWANCGV